MQSCAIAHSVIRTSVDQHSGPVDGDETEDHGRRSSVTPSVALGASQICTPLTLRHGSAVSVHVTVPTQLPLAMLARSPAAHPANEKSFAVMR